MTKAEHTHLQTTLHHAAVVVPNLDNAIDFYCRGVGAELVKRSSWETGTELFDSLTGLRNCSAKFCLLKIGHSYIELFEYGSTVYQSPAEEQADKLGIRHLAFQVADIEEAERNLTDAGASSVGERIHVTGGGSARYMRDPFGNIIELLVPGGKMPPA